jgi:D-3-phosphoglycerate dehydrogenase
VPTIFLTHTPDMLANYYGARALAALRAIAPVRVNETGAVLDAATLGREAKGCEIVVSDRQTAAPAEFFASMPDLVAFLRVAVDIRNIDLHAASAHGVLVTHATPGFVASVAEMAIGYMIDCARHITAATIDYRAGHAPEARMGRQLKGATLGIIGYGAIGEYLAQLGLAFGMTTLVTDPKGTIAAEHIAQLPLPDLLARSDYVICLAHATKETENLMDAAAFARMRKDAFFLNLSRGNLVDENALAAALDAGAIAGAAMDVGRAPDQKPSPALAARADVIATPHTAGLTPEAIEHQAFDTVNQVADLLAGRMPQGAANPDKAHRLARITGERH